MARFPGVRLAVLAALVAVAPAARAQGGWAQWDVRLRDGTRVEANPLGAPDSEHFSVSVGGFEGKDVTILRALVDYIAAQTTVGSRREPIPGVKLPELPAARECEDVLVRRDGRRSTGRVTFTRLQYSAGAVRQRGMDIDLDDVAYIRFARKPEKDCVSSRRRKTPVGTYSVACVTSHEVHSVGPDTLSLRSVVRDDNQ